MKNSMKAPFLLGRLIFGGFFLYNGIHHFVAHQSISQHAGSKNVPLPRVAVAASGVVLLAGGASILLGIKPKLGAAALIGFLATVSPAMHDFWSAEDARQRMNDTINFTKNMALIGSALALLSIEEPWPASVPVSQPSKLERAQRFIRQRIAA